MKKYLVLLLFGALTFTACDKDDTPTEPTLYERLGGAQMVNDPANSGQQIEQGYLALRSVVDSAIFVIAADTSLQPFFHTLLMEVGNGNLTGFTALSQNLTVFFAAATGSKNHTYTGLDMAAAHDPAQNSRMAMKADNADFDQFVTDVGVALGQNGVSDTELINDLVALLETLRGDVVQQ